MCNYTTDTFRRSPFESRRRLVTLTCFSHCGIACNRVTTLPNGIYGYHSHFTSFSISLACQFQDVRITFISFQSFSHGSFVLLFDKYFGQCTLLCNSPFTTAFSVKSVVGKCDFFHSNNAHSCFRFLLILGIASNPPF